MLSMMLSLIFLIVMLWTLYRIMQFVLRAMLGLVSAILCVLLLAVCIVSLLVIRTLGALQR